MSPDLELAHRLADAADALSLSRFRTGLAVETKPDLTPVTEADRAVEAELRRILRKCLEKDRERRYQTMRDVAIRGGPTRKGAAKPAIALSSTGGGGTIPVEPR